MTEETPASIMWFRRDLRVVDHEALAEAAGKGTVIPLYVIDPVLWDSSGDPRKHALLDALHALDEATDGKLVVRYGKPWEVVPEVAAEARASGVYVTSDHAPYGRKRDERVKDALGGAFHEVGSNYAVAPGVVRKKDGTRYKVYTPFYKMWREHVDHVAPVNVPDVTWDTLPSDGLPKRPEDRNPHLQEVTPREAKHLLDDFTTRIHEYEVDRNRLDKVGTSNLSAHLKYGTIHPRTILGAVRKAAPSHFDPYQREIAWREFNADLLWHTPESTKVPGDKRFEHLQVDTGPLADEHLKAWKEGRTGFPVVDAGIREMLATGRMHNRVRMIVASFLVKDLHLPWQEGAKFFMEHLVDGDTASNAHSWQWVAGCGADASPYHRVFNPTTQGEKFDPEGRYVRAWVPELKDVPGRRVHDQKRWDTEVDGYPEPIVDHAGERLEALTRYRRMREASQTILED